MRFRKKDEKNFFKVGLFISGMTIILMIMIATIGKENSVFNPKVEIRARVDNVKNLKPGSYVELKGIKVGTVKDINIISEDEVEIRISILKSQIRWIKQDSKISISTAGLVGDKYVEIFNGSKDSPSFNPEKDILISENLSDLKQIITKGESIAVLTERILNKMDRILYNLEDGKTIVDTMDSIHKASSNLEKISSELKNAHIGTTVKNMNTTMMRMEKASGSIERIMSRIEHGPGTMNSLIYDDGLHDDLRALLGGASRNKVIKYFIRESIKNSERKKTQTND